MFMEHENTSCMNTCAIRTVRELVDAFGGTGKLAGFLHVVPSAVSNMLADDYIPRSYHFEIYVEAKRREYRLDTLNLFGVPDYVPEKTQVPKLASRVA